MRTFALLVMGAFVLPVAVGCSQNSQVFRGQSPDVVHAQGYAEDGEMIGDPGTYADMNCPPGQGGCPPGKGGCLGCDAAQANYWAPCDLSYPTANAMPGIVQYPYYTLKGPDCFFHK